MAEAKRRVESMESRFSWFVGTPEEAVEKLMPWIEQGAGDILLGTAAPFDYQTLELVARQVAPAVRAEVAA